VAGSARGLELLEPLPAVLNQPHLADLELRAEPSHAGPRTLEYSGSAADER